MGARYAAAVAGLACLAAASSACAAGDATAAAVRSWEADLEGFVEWSTADDCVDWNADAIQTTTVAEGTMGELGAVSARLQHCPSDTGSYHAGTATFTMQDGDELRAEYDGVTDGFAADPRSWPMEITGGTGRFTSASGTVYLLSYDLDWGVDPPAWAGHLEGTVAY